MALNIGLADLIEACEDLLKASGIFLTVNVHEPKSTPGPDHGAVWVQTIRPLPEASGLNMVTGRVELTVRIYSSMLQEPQDDIDPVITEKTDSVIALFCGDFELGQRVRNVDLLGEHGEPLSGRAGYLTFGQGVMMRIMDITVPLIVNDLWLQGA